MQPARSCDFYILSEFRVHRWAYIQFSVNATDETKLLIRQQFTSNHTWNLFSNEI